MKFEKDKYTRERKAKALQALIFDVDGVLTDNRTELGLGNGNTRMRSYYDGQGISLLRAIGLPICFITNESGRAAQGLADTVVKFNNLPSSSKTPGDGGWPRVSLYLGMGGDKKVEAAEEWLGQIMVPFSHCGFMGDDLVDIALMKRVGFRAAPISAEKVVRKMCHFVSERPGGHGAIRDLANFILEVRGIDPTSLPPK